MNKAEMMDLILYLLFVDGMLPSFSISWFHLQVSFFYVSSSSFLFFFLGKICFNLNLEKLLHAFFLLSEEVRESDRINKLFFYKCDIMNFYIKSGIMMSSFHWYQFYQYVRFAASFSYIQFYHICIKKCMLGYISLCKMQITVFANITCHLNNFI